MRRSIPLLALLLATTAGCSQAVMTATPPPPRPPNGPPMRPRTRLRSQSAIPPELPAPRGRAEPRAPGRMSTRNRRPASPSTYRYSFRLEADRVAEMQREHQQLCARYGPRCRMTGIDYRAANEEDVEAMLSFLVDPAIAGQFGRESVRAVTAADGELTESEVSGTDVGTSLKANTGELEELQAELGADRGAARRSAICAGASAPRSRSSASRSASRSPRSRATDRRAGAGAGDHADPVPLRLGRARAGAGAAGRRSARRPSAPPTISSARSTSLLILFVTISPWVLTGLLAWLGFRAARKRWPGRPAPAEAAAAPEALAPCRERGRGCSRSRTWPLSTSLSGWTGRFRRARAPSRPRPRRGSSRGRRRSWAGCGGLRDRPASGCGR